MELVKRSVRLNCVQKTVRKMKTLDEDMNVPEMKKDINKIICCTHEAVIEGMKASERKESVKGYIGFDVLYLNSENGGLEHLEGKYPFEENFEFSDDEDLTNVKAQIMIEDFTVKIINSRKVNIRTLFAVECAGDEAGEEEIVVDVKDDNVLVQKENMVFSQVKANGEDTFRIKEDIELPKNKPNVQSLIFSDMRLKSRESRMQDDGVYIKGDIGIFIIYEPEGEDEVTQWYETAIPFEGKVEVRGVSEGMFSMIPLKLEETVLSMKPDYDGEERVICAEGIIRLDIRAFSEEETPVVWDMYSTGHHVDIESREKKYQQLVMKNNLKARGYHKYKVGDTEEKPLQICYAYGEAHTEQVKMEGDKMTVDGLVDVTVIYVSVNDDNPMCSFKCQVPFSQNISLEEQVQDCEYILNVCVDQINASMIGGDEIEVRAFVGLEVLIMRVMAQNFVESVEMKPMTSKELAAFPGMIGYIAQNQETLWDIAKRYKTTVEKIKAVNKMTVDSVRRGDKILIVR